MTFGRRIAGAVPLALGATLWGSWLISPMTEQRATNLWSPMATSSMRRIPIQGEVPGAQSNAGVWAARGETTAFQIAISAGARPITVTSIHATDANAQEGTIPARCIRILREQYVPVPRSSPDPGTGNRPAGPGWYADALVPLMDPDTGRTPSGDFGAVPFDVPAGENRALWVDLDVPRNAPAGTYTGFLQLESTDGTQSIEYSLHVWNWQLPVAPALRSSFGLHGANVRDRRTHELLLRHRIMPDSVNASDAADLMTSLGLNITRLPIVGHFNRQTCTMDPPPSAADIAAVRRRYPSTLPVHIYAVDEIGHCPSVFTTVRSWAAEIHRAGVRDLITVPPVRALQSDGGGDGRSAVDIWALLPKWWETAASDIELVRSKRDELWSYTALVQDSYSPKWEIDFAPANFRMMPGFLSQALRTTGILYWSVDRWTTKPWTDVYGYATAGISYPGEGMLLYPGTALGLDAPVPSIRLKWIRAGVNDYDYIEILKRLGRSELAERLTHEVASDWHTWSQDISLIESVRRRAGDEIERVGAQANLSSVRQSR